MMVCGISCGENGLKTARCWHVASAGSVEWMLRGYVGMYQGRRVIGLFASFGSVPANDAAAEAVVASSHGWRRREVRE
jgi:hypothetical protein